MADLLPLIPVLWKNYLLQYGIAVVLVIPIVFVGDGRDVGKTLMRAAEALRYAVLVMTRPLMTPVLRVKALLACRLIFNDPTRYYSVIV